MEAVSNARVADVLDRYGALLEISGESPFRTRAYRRAADAVRALAEPIGRVDREGRLREIEGVGEGIAAAISAIVRSGRYDPLDALAERYPFSLLELLDVPGIGVKTVGRLHDELGIADLATLEEAAATGRLRALKGFGAKLEATVLDGLETLKSRTGRISIGVALPAGRRFVAEIAAALPTATVSLAGSARRVEETVGDLDLVVAHHDRAMARRVVSSLPTVARLVDSHGNRQRVELQSGLPVDCFFCAPGSFGSTLVRATGNTAHLRRFGEVPDHLASEEEVYGRLGLAPIPPELRQGRQEWERASEIASLIATRDVRAQLHCHTTWSDGSASVEAMAEAARQRGLETLAITDHSQSLGVAGGLSVDRLRRQRLEIDAVAARTPIRLLQGAEVEVARDGRLDYDAETLARLDLVVASLHSGLRQPRQPLTERMLAVIGNPNVDVIAHPSGRLIERRPGGDFDWDRLFAAAAETGTALEINADPMRLDLDDRKAAKALLAGCLLSINCDAHHPDGFDLLEYGVAVARRAWAYADRVINCWATDRLLSWLARGGSDPE